MLERAGCGWDVEPEWPKALASAMREVVAVSAGEWVHRGQASRKCALKHRFGKSSYHARFAYWERRHGKAHCI
jgi:hypothetical protein